MSKLLINSIPQPNVTLISFLKKPLQLLKTTHHCSFPTLAIPAEPLNDKTFPLSDDIPTDSCEEIGSRCFEADLQISQKHEIIENGKYEPYKLLVCFTCYLLDHGCSKVLYPDRKRRQPLLPPGKGKHRETD